MLLIHFAVLAEAIDTLHTLKAKEIGEGLYQFQREEIVRGKIVIGGMGALSTIASIVYHGEGCKEIWSFGAAGTTGSYARGECVEVATIAKNSLLPQGIDSHSKELFAQIHPKIFLKQSGVSLITSDYPIHLSSLREELEGDLVDMEGYGVAKAALVIRARCRIWKIVTDFCEEGGAQMIKQQLSNVSQISSQQIAKLTKK